jgi:outer membrane receptor protein involved in Fe transport
VGARWVSDRITIGGAVYRTDVEDDISFIGSDAARLAGYFANIGETRRAGVELSAQVQTAAGHTLYVNYAYTRASFRTAATIYSIRSMSQFAPGSADASALYGRNEVGVGTRLPLVPDHQARFGASLALGSVLEAGVDARYTGQQWLRGDEANETTALAGYFTGDARLEWQGARWSVATIVSNVLDSHAPIFGTFNENRQTGQLERFLTPLNARAFKVVVRHATR